MPEPKYITFEEIRQLFNESNYPALIRTGQLRPEYIRNQPLKDPLQKNEPAGTRSQIIRYRDRNGQWMVVVHQYLRPNGTLGGSGLPDPKRLRIGNTVFIAARDPDEDNTNSQQMGFGI
jgi:hypothetical protein